ncbi:activin receptor type-2B [Contarinia nasturtii]|uniref:activin receptor type-2B n=1 Tax=Contarinia nasturtii TaxID=265458 RepID=UPI0012D3D76D|nr:activin receptor type-2B [Contarinia nasturtii]
MCTLRFVGCVTILLFILYGNTYAAVTARKGVGLICADYRSKPTTDDESSAEYEDVNDKNIIKNEKMKEKKCDNENDVCYAVWKIDANGTRIIESQGCLLEKPTSCGTDECINNRPQWPLYCCCTGHMCNINITDRPKPIIEPNIYSIDNDALSNGSFNETFLSALKSQRLWIVVLIISIPMIVSLIYVTLCRNRFTKPEPKLLNVPSPNPKYSSDLLNVDNLKLCSMIGQGKYGTVWKGMINEQTVAVKLFPAQHKDFFLNEKDIYCLLSMDSPYFLEYFGCDERRTLDDNIEYLLVLSLAPLGCLQDWLTQNTASFEVYIKMSRSVAGGLSYLHTEMNAGNAIKPCVAHRDLNTRNILVRADQSCCISDFGFALKTFGPRYEWKGAMTLAEHKSLNEVGTIRYMAPEILEGAVNLRDCETALKQVDIYSLGLVLWELYSRCHEFYASDEPISAYKQPYEAEVGKTPSLEQMQILVSRQKVRPKFTCAWKRNVSAKIAKDTCEDCWDHDPDARLTALCVEERLREISTHRLQSPTVAEATTLITTFKSNPNILRSVNDTFPISNHHGLGSTSDDIKVCNGDKHLSTTSKLLPKLHGWTKIRSLLNKRNAKRSDEMSILTSDYNKSIGKLGESQPPSIFQQSNLVDNNRVHIKTKHLPQIRPKNLDLALPHINAPDTSLVQSEITDYSSSFRNYQSMYKRPPGDFSQQFTIIDEADHQQQPSSHSNRLKKSSGLVVSKSANAMKSLQTSDYPDEWHMKRQRSLEVFRDVFGVKGSIDRLRDPSERIKTPGDVPKSVRKVRASKTLSLYDDRMMMNASTTGMHQL